MGNTASLQNTVSEAADQKPPASTASGGLPSSIPTQILYGSLSNTSKKFAQSLQETLAPHASVSDMTSMDPEDLLARPEVLLLLVISSYNVETALDSALQQYDELANDFRVGSAALHKTRVAILGVGHAEWKASSEYQCHAKRLQGIMQRLGAKCVVNMGEVDTADDKPEAAFDAWQQRLVQRLQGCTALQDVPVLDVAPQQGEEEDELVESASEEEQEEEEEQEDESSLTPAQRKLRAAQRKARMNKPSGDADIEDLASRMPPAENGKSASSQVEIQPKKTQPKEMVSNLTRKTLTKQGYAVVGSHSGVKTCRWTKAALRGRGMCYKHSFYGIMSHRCMETTPSLACANKCTYCWRSHSNPVGTSWRWATDNPEMVVDGAMSEHDRMIKQLKGLPGLNEERFDEARTPRHAALSLVGEPIMYPHIKEYIRLLHSKHISTFLVTNAQFPEPMKTLPPVTQLYLSIDAGDKISLKNVDRPLHRDFWERLLQCVEMVRERPERTVFRLTLVKEFNAEEVAGYASLVKLGRPDMIEVKGVTYCGYGGSSGLSIKNSPFHNEVVSFVQALVDELDEDEETRGNYALASEHAHSCCVLAAQTKYRDAEGSWHTWIDYDRFFELVESGKPFTATDYMAETPDFAQFGHEAQGFSPADVRWHRKTKGAVEAAE